MKEANTPQHPGEEVLLHIDLNYVLYPHSGEIWSHLVKRTIGSRSNGCPVHEGYSRIGIKGKFLKYHHVVFYMYYRRWPRQQLDHKNKDKNDNRPENLEEVSNAENQARRWGKNVSRETLSQIAKTASTGIHGAIEFLDIAGKMKQVNQ